MNNPMFYVSLNLHKFATNSYRQHFWSTFYEAMSSGSVKIIDKFIVNADFGQ